MARQEFAEERREHMAGEGQELAWAYRFIWLVGGALVALMMIALVSGADAAEPLTAVNKLAQSAANEPAKREAALLVLGGIFAMMIAISGFLWQSFGSEQSRARRRIRARMRETI